MEDPNKPLGSKTKVYGGPRPKARAQVVPQRLPTTTATGSLVAERWDERGEADDVPLPQMEVEREMTEEELDSVSKQFLLRKKRREAEKKKRVDAVTEVPERADLFSGPPSLQRKVSPSAEHAQETVRTREMEMALPGIAPVYTGSPKKAATVTSRGVQHPVSSTRVATPRSQHGPEVSSHRHATRAALDDELGELRANHIGDKRELRIQMERNKTEVKRLETASATLRRRGGVADICSQAKASGTLPAD
jgi:hypothetical protein